MVDLDKLVTSLIEGEGSITRHDLIKALNEQGLILSYESSGYTLAKKLELKQPFKVEKDKVYMCIKNFELSNGTFAYIKGHLYKGDGRGCLETEQGSWLGHWEENGSKYFRLATEDEISQEPRSKNVADVLEDAVTGILTTVDRSMSAAGIKRSITFQNTTPEQERILKSIYDSWQQQS